MEWQALGLGPSRPAGHLSRRCWLLRWPPVCAASQVGISLHGFPPVSGAEATGSHGVARKKLSTSVQRCQYSREQWQGKGVARDSGHCSMK